MLLPRASFLFSASMIRKNSELVVHRTSSSSSSGPTSVAESLRAESCVSHISTIDQELAERCYINAGRRFVLNHQVAALFCVK